MMQILEMYFQSRLHWLNLKKQDYMPVLTASYTLHPDKEGCRQRGKAPTQWFQFDTRRHGQHLGNCTIPEPLRQFPLYAPASPVVA